jgi:hypothetical protein
MELISTYICKTGDIGVHSNMFGGHMLGLIDESAVVYDMQLCDTPRMVTVMVTNTIEQSGIKRVVYCEEYRDLTGIDFLLESGLSVEKIIY